MCETNNLEKKLYKIVDKTMNWEEAIKFSANELLEQKYFNNIYVDEMIENVKKFGSYIVIAPKIALPHAKFSENVFKGGYAVTVFKNGIDFDGKNELVYLMITISSTTSDEHLNRLKEISNKLSNGDLVNNLIAANDNLTIMKLWKEE